MKSQCELGIARSGSALHTRKEGAFCGALAGSLSSLDVMTAPLVHPKGAVLFMEGQAADGLFALCSGQVKLFTSSLGGKVIILRIAEAGELLGLPATISGKPYEMTAEVSEPARVNFIPRESFLRFMRGNPEAVIQVAQLLTHRHYEGHQLIQSLVLSRTASEKLARFLLGWSANHARGQDSFQITLTQDEMGEMMGMSRETVTRVLSAFKKKNLVTVKGATFTINNRAELQSLAGK